MAYDRYDARGTPRDESSRWTEGREPARYSDRVQGEDRGFFERAGEEIASWFGDENADRRRQFDLMREPRRADGAASERYRERSRNRLREFGRDRDRDWNDNRGLFASGGSSEADYNPTWRRELSGGQGREDTRRAATGDYGRAGLAGRFLGAGNYGPIEEDRFYRDRSDSPWGQDEYRRTSRAGTADFSDRSRHEDPHYDSWRQRHMAELDQDYDEYRRENQARFERDFGSWRERRIKKRSLLGQVREQMEVVGIDDQHVGTIDAVTGDQIIHANSDPESGGVRHSMNCSAIDHIDGDKVILEWSASEAHERWRDEKRNRALFERKDQDEMRPGVPRAEP